MRKDINSALLSVGEVAVFAFSLLELLLTRILPLAGFLAGHLLLHFCHLLASIFGFALGRRKPRGESSCLTAEVPFEEACVQLNDNGQDYQYEESLNDHRQLINVSRDEADVLQGAMSATQVADATAEIVDDPHVADSTPSDAQIIDSRPSHLPANDAEGAMSSSQEAEQLVDFHLHAPPSDAKLIDIRPSNLPANGVKAVDSNEALVYESGQLALGRNGAVVGEDQSHVVKSESSDGQNSIGLGSSDAQSSDEGAAMSGTLEVSPSTNGEMRRDGSKKRSSMRSRAAAHMHMRVLPPSLSQIKRTLMQRSRRSSPHQSKSPYKPKKQSPRPRKFASALKSSTSNDNFMRKFRKHFLIPDST